MHQELHQQSIRIEDRRSPYTGDSTGGHVRISQSITDHLETPYEVWTDRVDHKLVIYQTQGETTYSYIFNIADIDQHEPVLTQTTIKSQPQYQPSTTLDDTSYGMPDKTGKQTIRNNLVLPGDTMVNDTGQVVEAKELQKKHAALYQMARYAVQHQDAFLHQVARNFGMWLHSPRLELGTHQPSIGRY